MYLSDSGTGSVDAFDFDGVTGAIGARRPLVRIDLPGVAPDGLTVDERGDIWVGLYGGWAVNCYGPEGSLRATVQIPAAQATSCAFGGNDRRTLFVTTGRERLDQAALERQPDAGRVFSVTGLGARGPGGAAYRGRMSPAGPIG
jgi:sugar lactone lactonase YvrE